MVAMTTVGSDYEERVSEQCCDSSGYYHSGLCRELLALDQKKSVYLMKCSVVQWHSPSITICARNIRLIINFSFLSRSKCG